MASLGQSFPDCGLQSPQCHKRVQMGLRNVRKNSAGQQLLTFSWLEEWGCGFTRLSLQHQFWLLVFPFQPSPIACFIFPPAVHGPLGSPAALVCGSAVKRIRNLIQFGERHIKNEVFLCQAIFELDLFPAPVHCTDASMLCWWSRGSGVVWPQSKRWGAGTQRWQNHRHQGDLITGGKRLCSLESGELLCRALIAGSSSAPPEKGSEHLSLKPKLQLSPAVLLPVGHKWLLARCRQVFQKGATFSTC